MNTISFHKILSKLLIKKIESFYLVQDTIGLHQVLDFTQLMEPQKKVTYCIAENENKDIIGYCVIHYRFPIAFIQDGPVSNDSVVISEMISAIRTYYSHMFFAFTTIQLPLSKGIYHNIVNNESIAKLIDLPTWSTILVELTDLDVVTRNFTKGHLSAIKKADKSGLIISNEVTNQTITDFAKLFDETYKSRKIATQWQNSEIYFKTLSQKLNNKGYFIGAYLDRKLVAGGFFIKQGKTVHYKYGASNHELRSIPLMHTVIYNAMLHAMEQGACYFDLGGINPNAPEGSQIHAINTFKKGFGGTIVTSPERIFISNHPISLAIIVFLLKLKKLIRK